MFDVADRIGFDVTLETIRSHVQNLILSLKYWYHKGLESLSALNQLPLGLGNNKHPLLIYISF
jgi:hypothetical protein